MSSIVDRIHSHLIEAGDVLHATAELSELVAEVAKVAI